MYLHWAELSLSSVCPMPGRGPEPQGQDEQPQAPLGCERGALGGDINVGPVEPRYEQPECYSS